MTDAEQRKPFAAFVQEQRNGGLHGEMSEALTELVTTARETGRAGTITLTIKVTPNKDNSTVTVSDKVKLTLPEPERGAGIFFFDEHGNLSRQNPNQTSLTLREVERPAVKDIGEARVVWE